MLGSNKPKLGTKAAILDAADHQDQRRQEQARLQRAVIDRLLRRIDSMEHYAESHGFDVDMATWVKADLEKIGSAETATTPTD